MFQDLFIKKKGIAQGIYQCSQYFMVLNQYLGVSENSVPLNPMVLLIIIPMKNCYFIGNIPNIFRQTHLEL